MKRLLAALLIANLGLAACSQKITNPEIEKLENRQELLEETTLLNKYKLALEKETLREQKLKQQVEDANDEATKSANKAKDLSDRLSNNAGNGSLSSKKEIESKAAAKDAKKAKKLNNQL